MRVLILLKEGHNSGECFSASANVPALVVLADGHAHKTEVTQHLKETFLHCFHVQEKDTQSNQLEECRKSINTYSVSPGIPYIGHSKDRVCASQELIAGVHHQLIMIILVILVIFVIFVILIILVIFLRSVKALAMIIIMVILITMIITIGLMMVKMTMISL